MRSMVSGTHEICSSEIVAGDNGCDYQHGASTARPGHAPKRRRRRRRRGWDETRHEGGSHRSSSPVPSTFVQVADAVEPGPTIHRSSSRNAEGKGPGPRGCCCEGRERETSHDERGSRRTIIGHQTPLRPSLIKVHHSA
jgi:hypothetical protein